MHTTDFYSQVTVVLFIHISIVKWSWFFVFKWISPYTQVPLSSVGGKKSIFARQIAAQRLKEGKTPLHCAAEPTEQNLPPETSMDTDQCDDAGDHELTSCDCW